MRLRNFQSHSNCTSTAERLGESNWEVQTLWTKFAFGADYDEDRRIALAEFGRLQQLLTAVTEKRQRTLDMRNEFRHSRRGKEYISRGSDFPTCRG